MWKKQLKVIKRVFIFLIVMLLCCKVVIDLYKQEKTDDVTTDLSTAAGLLMYADADRCDMYHMG